MATWKRYRGKMLLYRWLHVCCCEISSIGQQEVAIDDVQSVIMRLAWKYHDVAIDKREFN